MFPLDKRPRLTMSDLAELEEEFRMPIQDILAIARQGYPEDDERETEEGLLRSRIVSRTSWLILQHTL